MVDGYQMADGHVGYDMGGTMHAYGGGECKQNGESHLVLLIVKRLKDLVSQ